MKKTIGILFSLAFALSLSACGNNPPSLQDRVGQTTPPADQGSSTMSYSGVIEPLQISAFQDGTHQIKTDSGETVVIQSSTVNLSAYLGKKVTIKGSMQKLDHNTQEVFTVEDIQESDAGAQATLHYESKKWGFGFDYSQDWTVFEGATLQLKKGDSVVVQVASSDLDTTLDDYVASHEVEDGTSVTVGGQKSVRYATAGKIWIYTPNPSIKKVYKIEFLGGDSDTGAFDALLESFDVLEVKTVAGDKCGGTDNLGCTEGFRCDLQSADEAAEGVCVKVDDTQSPQDCPFVPKPENCVNVVPKSLSKNGCPTSYACADKPSDASAPAPAASEAPSSAIQGPTIDAVLAEFHKAQSGLLPGDAEVQQYELVTEQSLLAVVYTQNGAQFRTLYQYSAADSGTDFQWLASFKQGDKRDWELTEGKDVKITADVNIVKPGADTSVPRVVGKDMRLYENFSKGYSVQYPKDWYYRSFGALDGNESAVGFADKPFDRYADSVITLVIAKGKSEGKKEVRSDLYHIESPRDDSTHFVLEGPLGMKDDLEKMAGTLTLN
jgi:hypothetical protein